MDEKLDNQEENRPAEDENDPLSVEGDEEILEVDNSAINSSGNNAFNIDKSIVDTINHYTVNYEAEVTDTTFPCPDCGTPLDAKKYGKIVCPNHECEKVIFRRNTKVEFSEFDTIFDKKESEEYKRILTHIYNKLKAKNYRAAYEYCLKAEKIAPAESTTWEYLALCEFLFEINIRYGKGRKRKPTQQIVNSVRNHLMRCKDYGIKESRYEELCGDIANKLFYYEKNRLNSIRHLLRDANGNEILVSRYVGLNVSFIKSFELCYSLYPDPHFLEEYVKELSKPHKWIKKGRDDVLTNNPICGNFSAVLTRERLINKIREQKPHYSPPEIIAERFKIINDDRNERFKILGNK